MSLPNKGTGAEYGLPKQKDDTIDDSIDRSPLPSRPIEMLGDVSQIQPQRGMHTGRDVVFKVFNARQYRDAWDGVAQSRGTNLHAHTSFEKLANKIIDSYWANYNNKSTSDVVDNDRHARAARNRVLCHMGMRDHNDDVVLPPNHMSLAVDNDDIHNDELDSLPDLTCDSSDDDW
jgi:hypothetical protein